MSIYIFILFEHSSISVTHYMIQIYILAYTFINTCVYNIYMYIYFFFYALRDHNTRHISNYTLLTRQVGKYTIHSRLTRPPVYEKWYTLKRYNNIIVLLINLYTGTKITSEIHRRPWAVKLCGPSFARRISLYRSSPNRIRCVLYSTILLGMSYIT